MPPLPPLPHSPHSPPTPPKHKSVTFCSHCNDHTDRQTDKHSDDVRYYSDPGDAELPRPKKKKKESPKAEDIDLKYYSEPDANNYFEIDYEFLKELRRIAKNNCPKCKRKRKVRCEPKYVRHKEKSFRRGKEALIYCNGRYHSELEHCQFCCKVCNRSTETLDSIDDDQYSLISRSYSQTTTSSRSKSTPRTNIRERKNSIQSNKSVSFLDSTSESKDEPNYTAKSFTNDLKQFLLKPSPRLSLRDKFMSSFKQEIEATKKSPKLKAIKGLWKSY